MKSRRRYSKPVPLATITQPDDSNEGGLELGQILGAIRRRAIIVAIMTVLMAVAAAFKASKEKPVYQATFELLVEPVTIETQIISSVPGTLSSREEKASQGGLDATKLKVLKSSKLLSPVVEQLRTQYPSLELGTVIANLSITPQTNILAVSYQSPDAKQVPAVLDLVAKAYLNYSLEERKRDIQQGLEFVDKQLPQLRYRVEILQERLQKFRQEYNLIDPETQAGQLSSQLSGLTQQRLDTQVKLDEARSIYNNLKKELVLQPTESVTAVVLNQNPRYQKLLSQIKEIDIQIANESIRFLNGSPNIQTLREKRQSLIPLLNEEAQRVKQEIASSIEDLEVRNQALNQTINRLNQQLEALPIMARQYSDIQRELKIATDNLNQFLTKREALRIDAAQREVPWQLLTPANPPQPSESAVKKNLVMGAVLGLIVGLGSALLLDKTIDVIYSEKQAKRITRLLLLGIIPFNKKVKKLWFVVPKNLLTKLASYYGNLFKPRKAQPAKNSRFQEAFRSLYANIHLLNPDTPFRSLVISSAMPKEGKSTVAINLAQAIAAIGQRVLLVDIDLRDPSLHNYLGLVNDRGLTDVIFDRVDLNEAIERSPLEENLFVLTSGTVSSEPLKVLASENMQHLIEQLQANFDIVIYDAPSILGLSDVSLIAANTNGFLLVVGLGKLKRSLLEQALEELKVSKTPILGMVANHRI